MKSDSEQTEAVVIISAEAEWEATRELYPECRWDVTPFGQYFRTKQTVSSTGSLVFLQGGWGKISAAASAQYAIDRWAPGALVNLGTCGGFDGKVEREAVILVEKTIVYDIADKMGDPADCIDACMTSIDLSWLEDPYPHSVLRTTMLSADRDLDPDEVNQLHATYGAVVGDWESGAIAWVAERNAVKCLILRGVSDLVGAEGGEAYDGNREVFVRNAREILRRLVLQLPAWLECIADRGARG